MAQTISKVSGYKVIKIYAELSKVLCDVAVFGKNSLMVDNLQLCENLLKEIPYSNKEKIESQYGNELPHNFINDLLIIH